MEIALKLRELTATVAEGFSSADLMHGPIAAIAPGTPAVIVAPRGRALARCWRPPPRCAAAGPRRSSSPSRRTPTCPLPPGVPEWLSPLVAVGAGQVLALRHAVVGGHAIDQPTGLTKVTETY